MISVQLFGWENELEREKKDFISYVKKQKLSAILLRM